MMDSKVSVSGFAAPQKHVLPLTTESFRLRTKQPKRINPGGSFRRLVRSVRRSLRPDRVEAHPMKWGALWVLPDVATKQRFEVIDDEGGVIDTWRLRASIARFERGEGERVDLDAVKERFGLTPGK